MIESLKSRGRLTLESGPKFTDVQTSSDSISDEIAASEIRERSSSLGAEVGAEQTPKRAKRMLETQDSDEEESLVNRGIRAVGLLLHKYGLYKYIDYFKEAQIDGRDCLELEQEDLVTMGMDATDVQAFRDMIAAHT
eukprot:TRINITY_DN12112_c0_g1_i19.p1 TRINITY_DN12112_c0_g1~~TRINITY_DN12112_c0_g1_i19.p1  ORF type:complete len:137 (+),score=29.48 TRINITY_DN12112_c0_g1_i19:366-776(+)